MSKKEKLLPIDFVIEKIKWTVILLILLSLIYGGHRLSTAVASNMVNERITVVLDAGHGGADPGKIGVNDALEKDINLKIVQEMKNILAEAGVRVIMTREDNAGLSENKQEDMQKRVEIINSSNAVLAVSIHQNSFTSEQEKGAQVFYYGQSEEGKNVAGIIQNYLKLLDMENRREIKENNSYYLLKKTEIPTVIVECGFLSNWEEAEKLIQEGYQRELAEVISEAILSYIHQE